jgi:hypothetical protein
MNKEIVTQEIAKVIKVKGYLKPAYNYYLDGVLCKQYEFHVFEPISTEEQIGKLKDKIFNAPTYHQLIDWVFEDAEKHINLNPKTTWGWIEFWYNLLKECPLKYEFKGRLLEWFRDNNITLSVTNLQDENYSALVIDNKGSIKLDGFTLWNNYKEAENEGILEIFKFLKKLLWKY